MKFIPVLTKSEASWGIIAVILVGLLVASSARNLSPDPSQIQAAASVRSSDILVDGLRCLSIDPRKVIVNEQTYSEPRLVETIAEILPVKAVLFDADVGTCPWEFFVTVVTGKVSAVRLHGQPAEYLVAIGICERTPNVTLHPGKCINKNIYVFNSGIAPHELLTTALEGLARSQAKEWEVFGRARPQ
ncbi:hypothetical protein LJR220_000924 [Bradyrhizobium sp. LjRoot220]|uniref:hypothetical protein n=1 Tax=Bradyrhizobium sp. LjRoot220 TaxID=3342284 RepID=UPI003ECE6A8E